MIRLVASRLAESLGATRLSRALLVAVLLMAVGCSPPAGRSPAASPGEPRPAVRQAVTQAPGDWWQPPAGTSWQWQLTGLPLDASFDVDMYDVDLFDTDARTVAALQAEGRKVICYLSAGSWEDWRPDADQFPDAVLGKRYRGWPGERWLDIRQIDLLAPDNVDGYTNDTGFPLTYQDQLDYNRWLADEAHARGLSIGLKNDGEQAFDLLADFDWAMVEDCFAADECSQFAPFVAAGKAVFAAEYTDEWRLDRFVSEVCPQAVTLGFRLLLKDRDLDAWQHDCP
jgi:hypothetical protein